jgi:hypothetical protein
MAAWTRDDRSPQPRDQALRRRKAPHTYFVGSRQFGAPLVYAVTAYDVEPLHPQRSKRAENLDWCGSAYALIELSHVLLTRIAEQRAAPALEARFALCVLAPLPEEGFILDSDHVWLWLRLTSQPEDFLEPYSQHRRTGVTRLLAGFRDIGAYLQTAGGPPFEATTRPRP